MCLVRAPNSCLPPHPTVSNTIVPILDTQEPFRHFLILPENTYRSEVQWQRENNSRIHGSYSSRPMSKNTQLLNSRRWRWTNTKILLFLERIAAHRQSLKKVRQQKLLKLDGAWERRCVQQRDKNLERVSKKAILFISFTLLVDLLHYRG